MGASIKTKLLTAVLFIIIFPVSLFANAGTPLVWAHLTYIFLSNILIALFEAHFIHTRLKLSGMKLSVFILLIANYMSAFTGLYLNFLYIRVANIDWDAGGYGSADEFTLKLIFLVSSFFISLAIEFPVIKIFHSFRIVGKSYPSKIDLISLKLNC